MQGILPIMSGVRTYLSNHLAPPGPPLILDSYSYILRVAWKRNILRTLGISWFGYNKGSKSSRQNFPNLWFDSVQKSLIGTYSVKYRDSWSELSLFDQPHFLEPEIREIFAAAGSSSTSKGFRTRNLTRLNSMGITVNLLFFFFESPSSWLKVYGMVAHVIVKVWSYFGVKLVFNFLGHGWVRTFGDLGIELERNWNDSLNRSISLVDREHIHEPMHFIVGDKKKQPLYKERNTKIFDLSIKSVSYNLSAAIFFDLIQLNTTKRINAFLNW